MDTVAWWLARDWFGGASVYAEFVVGNGPRDAAGDEGVPVLVDSVGKAGCELGIKAGWKFDDAIEFVLVGASVPKNDIGAADGVIKGLCGLTEEGSVAVRGKEVDIFVDVVRARVMAALFVGWFGSPDLRWDVDE